MKIACKRGEQIPGRHGRAPLLVAALFLFLPQQAGRAQGKTTLVDRVRAAVNGEVITQSDVNLEVAMYLLDGAEPSFSREEIERIALDRIIDRRLLLVEMRSRGAPAADRAEAEREMQRIKSKLESQGRLAEEIRQLRVTEEMLRRAVVERLMILAFAEQRFRPEVEVRPAEIESYYNSRLVPEMRRAGQEPPRLTEVEGKIRELLIQRKINQRLEEWLRQRRQTASVKLNP